MTVSASASANPPTGEHTFQYTSSTTATLGGTSLIPRTVDGRQTFYAITGTFAGVSIDVEEEDTYMVNGYITHNKGGNSHSDFSGPGAPTSLAYSSPFVSWTRPANTTTVGVTAVQVQIANNTGFTTPTIDYDEWSDNNIEVNTLLSAGTWYARVRAIEAGLKGAWSSTLTFTR